MMKRKRNKELKNMILTERDKAVIYSVYENRFLRRDQIQRLLFGNTSISACNMRLKKLYEHRFLDRLFKPVTVGKSQAVYALGKNGANVVADILETSVNQINWKRDHNRVEFLFMEHTLGISEFKVSLDLALQDKEAELLFYQRGNKSMLQRVSDPRGKKKYLVVLPDAFFGTETEKGKYYFFLEVDMGTEGLKRFQDKVIAYKEYWKSKKYTKTYGFKHFRVLTVSESPKRLGNLIKTTREANGRNMFLFTTFGMIDKYSLLEDIWLSPVLEDYISII